MMLTPVKYINVLVLLKMIKVIKNFKFGRFAHVLVIGPDDLSVSVKKKFQFFLYKLFIMIYIYLQYMKNNNFFALYINF